MKGLEGLPQRVQSAIVRVEPPSLDIAGDRWSDVNTNPLPAFPYLRTGSYTLLDVSAQYSAQRNVNVVFGLKNLTDRNYELSWGFPQPGRTFYVKTRVGL